MCDAKCKSDVDDGPVGGEETERSERAFKVGSEKGAPQCEHIPSVRELRAHWGHIKVEFDFIRWLECSCWVKTLAS